MEDAATAEISRAQVWQWVKHDAKLEDGRPVTAELVRQISADQLAKLKAQNGAGRFDDAGKIFEDMMTNPDP